MEKIISEIRNILYKAGVQSEIELSSPPNAEMGDFAFACFGIAKVWGINPAEAAKKIQLQIVLPHPLLSQVKVMGPYVNFYLNPGTVANLVVKEIIKKGKKYGSGTLTKSQKILIEYPSNNTHKEFHVGHFRNVCIGNTLAQLYEKNGYKIYPINYLNDFGSHVAKCLWGLQKFHKDEKAPANKQKWLGDIYAEASQKLKDNPDFAAEVAEIQKRLEAKDKTLWPLFIKTRQWSIDKFEEIFKDLGVQHRAVFYEKDLKEKGQKIVDKLLKEKIATVGEGGAIIIDLNPYKLDIALVRKSNGAGVYLTGDLSLAVAKFKKYKVNESIVITGTEQNFYFKQLYKILELMGAKQKLTHIGYGLVNLKEGKMSSRLGNVILYEDLYMDVFEKLKAESKERHPNWSEKKINTNVHVLALAALKFDMQKHEAAKNIIFDANEASSFEGFTGPYVLYSIARINSITRKLKARLAKIKVNYQVLDKLEEKQLVLLLAKYPEVVKAALAEYNPSVLTRYAFDVAQAFNNFYNKHSILKAETKGLVRARLMLAISVKNTLENALGLLTIDTVKEM